MEDSISAAFTATAGHVLVDCMHVHQIRRQMIRCERHLGSLVGQQRREGVLQGEKTSTGIELFHSL